MLSQIRNFLAGLSGGLSVESLQRFYKYGFVVMAVYAAYTAVLVAELVSSRRQAIQYVEMETLNQARSLDESLVGDIEKIDAMLREVRFQLEPMLAGGGGAPDARAVNDILARFLSYMPESQSLRVAGPDGHFRYDSTGRPAAAHIWDRPYFAEHRDNPNSGLVVSDPIFARITNNWVFTLSRRLSGPRGEFLGVVQAAISADRLQKAMRRVSLGDGDVLTVLTRDFRLLARTPGLPEKQGHIVSESFRRALQDTGMEEGSLELTSPLDQQRRIFGFRRNDASPFVVLAGRPVDKVLLEWTHKAIFYSVCLLSGLVLLSVLMVLWSSVYRRAVALAAQMSAESRATAERLAVANQELETHQLHLQQMVQERTRSIARLNEELRLRASEAEAANGAKSAFLASMSHEIRTPLNAIIGLTDLIRRKSDDGEQRDRLDKVISAGRHLLHVINDVLDLSKIEAGKLVLNPERFDVRALGANVMSMLSESARAKGLALTVEAGPLPSAVSGDATRLTQSLLNLAGNAIKFTTTGRVVIRSLAEEEEDARVKVRFEVEDTGIGLDEATISRLFAPFEQAAATTAREFGGTGLGLAITRRLAELMGGTAGVISTPGQGSVFWFTAWLTKESDGALPEAAGRLPDPAQRIRKLHGGRRVLLVEDNEINQIVAYENLDEAGLLTEIAGDGLAAVERLETLPPDHFALILMDMQMPRMDGLEATRRIRQIPGLAHIPVIAMTANAFAEDRVRCSEAGMDDFVVKPVEPAQFFSTVLKWLSIGRTPE